MGGSVRDAHSRTHSAMAPLVVRVLTLSLSPSTPPCCLQPTLCMPGCLSLCLSACRWLPRQCARCAQPYPMAPLVVVCVSVCASVCASVSVSLSSAQLRHHVVNQRSAATPGCFSVSVCVQVPGPQRAWPHPLGACLVCVCAFVPPRLNYPACCQPPTLCIMPGSFSLAGAVRAMRTAIPASPYGWCQ